MIENIASNISCGEPCWSVITDLEHGLSLATRPKMVTENRKKLTPHGYPKDGPEKRRQSLPALTKIAYEVQHGF